MCLCSRVHVHLAMLTFYMSVCIYANFSNCVRQTKNIIIELLNHKHANLYAYVHESMPILLVQVQSLISHLPTTHWLLAIWLHFVVYAYMSGLLSMIIHLCL